MTFGLENSKSSECYTSADPLSINASHDFLKIINGMTHVPQIPKKHITLTMQNNGMLAQ